MCPLFYTPYILSALISKAFLHTRGFLDPLRTVLVLLV